MSRRTKKVTLEELEVREEECVCHWIRVDPLSPGRATAEVRVIVHTEDGRIFNSVHELKLELDE